MPSNGCVGKVDAADGWSLTVRVQECAQLVAVITRSSNKELAFDVAIMNRTHLSSPGTVLLQVLYWDLNTGCLLENVSRDISPPPNRCSHVLSASKSYDSQSTLVQAILSTNDVVHHRAYDWPQPLKHLKIGASTVKIKSYDDHLEVSVGAPTKGIELSVVADPDVRLSDVSIFVKIAFID